jgi:hypothetical protein
MSFAVKEFLKSYKISVRTLYGAVYSYGKKKSQLGLVKFKLLSMNEKKIMQICQIYSDCH